MQELYKVAVRRFWMTLSRDEPNASEFRIILTTLVRFSKL